MIQNPQDTDSPFFRSIPDPVFWPMLILCTVAAIIASQSLITGTFSLVSQAVSLDSFPPMRITHTDKSFSGQVYMPAANYILMVTTLGLVLFFNNANNLASAFGIAVTGTLSITTILFLILMAKKYPWSLPIMIPLCLLFLVIEGTFFAASVVKIATGGWVPLLIGLILIILMSCWKLGRLDITRWEKRQARKFPLESLQGTKVIPSSPSVLFLSSFFVIFF